MRPIILARIRPKALYFSVYEIRLGTIVENHHSNDKHRRRAMIQLETGVPAFINENKHSLARLLPLRG